jgi:hypothetical protein
MRLTKEDVNPLQKLVREMVDARQAGAARFKGKIYKIEENVS